jgi:hypothetical protein
MKSDVNHRLGLALLGLVALSACRSRSQEAGPSAAPAPAAPAAAATPAADPATLKIWLSNTGAIEMNGRIVELPELGAALDALAKRDGTVLFGQDVPGKEPNPNVITVLKMISDRSLTFRSALSRSFTDLAPDHHFDKH